MTKEIKNKTRALTIREKKINAEADMEMREYLDEQDISRAEPEGITEDSFYFNHLATTEQQALIEEHSQRLEAFGLGDTLKVRESLARYTTLLLGNDIRSDGYLTDNIINEL